MGSRSTGSVNFATSGLASILPCYKRNSLRNETLIYRFIKKIYREIKVRVVYFFV